MRIMTITAAVALSAFTGIAYVRYASKANRDRCIPPIFHTIPNVPTWIDLLSWSAWFVSVLLLCRTLPLWASIAIFYAVVFPPWELLRRRHNHRVRSFAAPAGHSDVH